MLYRSWDVPSPGLCSTLWDASLTAAPPIVLLTPWPSLWVIAWQAQGLSWRSPHASARAGPLLQTHICQTGIVISSQVPGASMTIDGPGHQYHIPPSVPCPLALLPRCSLEAGCLGFLQPLDSHDTSCGLGPDYWDRVPQVILYISHCYFDWCKWQ